MSYWHLTRKFSRRSEKCGNATPFVIRTVICRSWIGQRSKTLVTCSNRFSTTEMFEIKMLFRTWITHNISTISAMMFSLDPIESSFTSCAIWNFMIRDPHWSDNIYLFRQVYANLCGTLLKILFPCEGFWYCRGPDYKTLFRTLYHNSSFSVINWSIKLSSDTNSH